MKVVCLVLLASLIACSSAKVGLRDPDFWKPLPLFDLLNEQMFSKPFGSGGSLPVDGFLSELAQAAAESEEEATQFFNSYKYPADRNVLVWRSERKGASTLETLLTKDYNDFMEHMSGTLHFRYKNNTMDVRVRELQELMNVAKCDVNMVPLKCDPESKQKRWEGATGQFIWSNDNYKYNVKFNDMLKVYNSMLKPNEFRYELDIFKNTQSILKYKNENYELDFEVNKDKDSFGDAFWPNKQEIWGMPDRESLFKTMSGNVHLESHLKHNYLECDMYVNEVFTDDISPYTDYNTMTEAQVREITDRKFKTMNEMYDRETIFKSFDRYGFGVALNKNGNINLVFAFSSPINNNVKEPVKPLSQLFNGLNNWPYIGVPTGRPENNQDQTNWWGQIHSENPLSRDSNIKLWLKANQLTFNELNKVRVKGGLHELSELNGLNKIAQAAADKMANAGKFLDPVIPKASNDILIVAMLLNGDAKMNEYLFQINDRNFGQLTCFDNYSNQKYPVRQYPNEVDNFRYSCSINSGRDRNVKNWKLFDSYGTGVAFNQKGDTFLIFALTTKANSIRMDEL